MAKTSFNPYIIGGNVYVINADGLNETHGGRAERNDGNGREDRA